MAPRTKQRKYVCPWLKKERNPNGPNRFNNERREKKKWLQMVKVE